MYNNRPQYIKCLNPKDLIEFLLKENFKEEADILKPRDIDGMRFLEFTELDLVKWNLSLREKKQLLSCRNKIIGKHPPEVAKKPNIIKKTPPIKTGKSLHFARELETKLNLKESDSKTQYIEKASISTAREGKNIRESQQYVDMTQNINKPTGRDELKAQKPTVRNRQMSPIRRDEWKKDKFTRITDTNHDERFRIKVDQNNHLKENGLLLEKMKSTYNKIKYDYSNPNQTVSSVAENIRETTRDLSQIQIKSDKRCPAAPPTPNSEYCEESLYEREPEESNSIYELEPILPISKFENNNNHLIRNPPVPPIYKKKALPQPTPFDNHKEVPIQKQVPIQRPSPSSTFSSERTTLKEVKPLKGEIWNVSKDCKLPKPPIFSNKFEQANSNLVRTLLEDDLEESYYCRPNEFNPHNCKYFRNTDRRGAIQLLKRIPNLENGVFLFRNSEEYFLVITIYWNNRFFNLGLQKNEDGSFSCKTDLDGKELTFTTLEAFVEFYKANPLTVKSRCEYINICLKDRLPDHIF